MAGRIRRAERSDAPALGAIYAPFISNNATSFEMAVPDPLEIERRILAHQDRYPWLVFERERTVLGYAYASAHRAREAYQWCAEVSVYVDSRAHRIGVGRALYTALFDLLRRQGFVNAYAGVTLPNPPSIGLHESLGFAAVGVYRRIGFKLGRWHDVAWLQLRLIDDAHPQAPPVAMDDIWEAPGVAAMLARCAQIVRDGSAAAGERAR